MALEVFTHHRRCRTAVGVWACGRVDDSAKACVGVPEGDPESAGGAREFGHGDLGIHT